MHTHLVNSGSLHTTHTPDDQLLSLLTDIANGQWHNLTMVCSNNVIIIAGDSEVLRTSKQGESPKTKPSGDVYI